MVENRELIRRNCTVPFLWVVHQELHRSVLIRNRLTGEIRILDKI